MTEGEKWKTNRELVPKKDIISVTEKEHRVLNGIHISYRKDLESLIKEYRDIFPENLPKERVYLPHGKYKIISTSNQTADPPTDHHIDGVLLSRMS